MARNDVILVDGIVTDRVAKLIPSSDRGEVFEFFCLEQLLKNYDVDQDEIEAGWVDGANDGGIDGFYIFVNGNLLTDVNDFAWPKRNPHIEIFVCTCKHEAGYSQAPLNSIHASVAELFDLGKGSSELNGKYAEALLDQRELLSAAYLRLSSARPDINFYFHYVSRGNASDVAENIRARANQIIATTKDLFSACGASFVFSGAKELVELSRRERNFCLDLPYQELLTREGSNFIVLVRLLDYYRFMKETDGSIRRYLFDSNVRDYLESTVVNEDINRTLADSSSPDFWWLNNGVTVLATLATAAPGKRLKISDVQIVNGLQTSESIYNHFSTGEVEDDRAVLVKVIVSTDSLVRDKIIRATNNQNPVEHASLRATDKIQRDIEAELERFGWFYERRKNYYKIAGQPAKRFVTPLFAAAAFTSLVRRRPYQAVSLRSRFMRNEESYRQIFSDYVPIEVWPKIVDVTKRVDDWLAVSRGELGHSGERFMATWRHLLSFLAVGVVLKKFKYSQSELLQLDSARIDSDLLTRIWSEVIAPQFGGPNPKRSIATQRGFVLRCCDSAASVFGVSDYEAFAKELGPEGVSRSYSVVPLTDELINAVRDALPPQPWKPGMLQGLMSRLQIPHSTARAAVGRLIELGKFHRQEHGVVYASDGTVIARDPDRDRSSS